MLKFVKFLVIALAVAIGASVFHAGGVAQAFQYFHAHPLLAPAVALGGGAIAIGMQDFYNKTKFVIAIKPQASTGATSALVGAIHDMTGYDSITFVINYGALYEDSVWTPSLEYGDDSALADTAAVASTELLGTIAGATITESVVEQAGGTVKIGYAPRSVAPKRYIRLTMTAASGGATSYLGAVAVQQSARTQPVA